MARVRIGISGWRYAGWRGDFYPKGLRQRRRAGVRRRADDVGRDQRLVLLAAAPELVCRVAGPDARRLRLRGQGRPLHHPHEEAARRRDPARQLLRLGGARARAPSSGPCCGSCRERLAFDAERLAAFFDLLPRTTAQAAELARRHDDKLAERPGPHRPPRSTSRSATRWSRGTPSFDTDEALALLRRARHRACVVADSAGRWPLHERRRPATSATCGCTATPSSTPAATATRRSTGGPGSAGGGATRGTTCYVYFDNDAKGYAPHDAISLIERVDRDRGASA